MEKTKKDTITGGYVRCPGCSILLPLNEFAAALLRHPIHINNPNVYILCPLRRGSIKVEISEKQKTAREVRV